MRVGPHNQEVWSHIRLSRWHVLSTGPEKGLTKYSQKKRCKKEEEEQRCERLGLGRRKEGMKGRKGGRSKEGREGRSEEKRERKESRWKGSRGESSAGRGIPLMARF